jgi:hypothetical protein
MNKNIQQLRDEVYTLRSDAVLKSEIDDFQFPVYKTLASASTRIEPQEIEGVEIRRCP